MGTPVVCVLLLSMPLAAAAGGTHPGTIALTDSLGPEIDATERAHYHLFPDLDGFMAARFLHSSDYAYRLWYMTQGLSGRQEHTITISPLIFEYTRIHAGLVERHEAIRESGGLEGGQVVSCPTRAFLTLAAQADYDAAFRFARAALQDGIDDAELAGLRDTAWQLVRSRGLFLPGSLFDHSGRTELLVFSGYYGLWLGIALPVAFRADDPAEVGISLLVVPTASVVLTSRATRHASVSDGRAGMISLGGHLGTWQGLGWAGCADNEAHETVGIGVVSGLAGIGAATLLTASREFTPGHAEIANSGLPWGAWLGSIVAVLADHEDDDAVRDMLIGSDIGVLACYMAGRNSPVSRARVRFCNMAGVLGAFCGLGLDLMLEVHDEDSAFGIVGASSLLGLYIGTRATRNMGQMEGQVSAAVPGKASAIGDAPFVPRLSVYASPTHPAPTPALEVSLRF